MDTAALMLASAGLVGIGIFMATQFCHHVIEAVGVDAARKAASPAVESGTVGAACVGAGGAVLLVMAGRLRWAVAYVCWIATGAVAINAAVMIELGAGARVTAQQAALLLMPMLLLPIFFYLVVGVVRASIIRPVLDMLDFLGEMLETIATKGPWGPRWGKVLAVLAAIWLVVGGFLVLRAIW